MWLCTTFIFCFYSFFVYNSFMHKKDIWSEGKANVQGVERAVHELICRWFDPQTLKPVFWSTEGVWMVCNRKKGCINVCVVDKTGQVLCKYSQIYSGEGYGSMGTTVVSVSGRAMFKHVMAALTSGINNFYLNTSVVLLFFITTRSPVRSWHWILNNLRL